ncbi:MAG: hypothetical protein M3N19_07175 [Candidatus Eremiobacteraeota bacterium]|nr:hypothetical protein [Candidatus Eremiobacteraeota bacterium]
MLTQLVNWLFPAQCGGCQRIGVGLCEHCLPPAPAIPAFTPTLRVQALGRYEGPLRAAILALKDGRRDVGREMGIRLAAFIEPRANVVPVPTTRLRRSTRGFDGSELLARSAAITVDLRVCTILSQIAGDAQRGRDRPARLAARGRFKAVGEISGRTFILLDDVMTTGATLEDCAATLRASGGIVQQAIVVAVSDRP